MKVAIPWREPSTATGVTIGHVAADGTVPHRGKLYYLKAAIETAGDGQERAEIQRITAQGTSTAVTPRAIDSGDSAAMINDAGENHTVEPTYTANSSLLSVEFNQRATFQWYAPTGGELVHPATANNGFGLLFVAGTTALILNALAHYSEE